MFTRIRLYGLYLRLAMYVSAIAAITLATVVSYYLSPQHLAGFHAGTFWQLAALTTLIWALVAEANGTYDIASLLQENTGIRLVAGACTTTYSILLVILFLVRQTGISRLLIVTSSLLLFVLTIAHRFLFRTIVARTRPWRRQNRVLIVGADKFARCVALRLTRAQFSSATIVGFVRLPGQVIGVAGAKVYSMEELAQISLHGVVDEILIAVPLANFQSVTPLLAYLNSVGAPIRAAIRFGRSLRMGDKPFTLGRFQVVDLADTPAESIPYLLLKRVFDVVFSAAALIVTSPLLAAIAIGIKVTSPGPILFVQERIGLNGRIFRMFKFRTMRVSPRDESDTVWTRTDDPRRTAFGSMLRKTSLDELPQFVNVLKGDMSVVGPRPERPHFARKFAHEYRMYNQRHRLKVGITGWAQVNGFRGDTSIEKRIQHDLYYLQNWTFGLDLQIVIRTLYSGLISKNAY